MSSKKKASGKKVTKPATTPAATTASRKERKPRKPPLERAIRLAGLFIKSRVALAKNVKGWAGEATREQRLAITRIVNEMKKLENTLRQVFKSSGDLVLFLREKNQNQPLLSENLSGTLSEDIGTTAETLNG